MDRTSFKKGRAKSGQNVPACRSTSMGRVVHFCLVPASAIGVAVEAPEGASTTGSLGRCGAPRSCGPSVVIGVPVPFVFFPVRNVVVDFQLNLQSESVEQAHPTEPLVVAPEAPLRHVLELLKAEGAARL